MSWAPTARLRRDKTRAYRRTHLRAAQRRLLEERAEVGKTRRAADWKLRRDGSRIDAAFKGVKGV